MVWLTNLRGFTCSVECNGQTLDEHHDEDIPDTPNTATRYTEAVTGADLKINIDTFEDFSWGNTSFTSRGA